MSLDPKSNYYDEGGIETIEIIQAKLTRRQYKGYLLGNILKYASRLNYKGADLRDSEKLAMYSSLLRDIHAAEIQSLPPAPPEKLKAQGIA